jgi:hypothetical protein
MQFVFPINVECEGTHSNLLIKTKCLSVQLWCKFLQHILLNTHAYIVGMYKILEKSHEFPPLYTHIYIVGMYKILEKKVMHFLLCTNKCPKFLVMDGI